MIHLLPLVTCPLSFSWEELINGQKFNGFSWCVQYAFPTFQTKIYTRWPSEIVDKKSKYAYLFMYLFMLLVCRTTTEKLSQKLCGCRLTTIKGDFLGIFLFFNVLHSTLLHLPPLRFHCADGCWDRSRTQDRCN